MDKIFVRERRKVMEGEKKPRFRVVAATGNLKVFTKHARKVELEAIAEATGSELIFLPNPGDGSGGGKSGKK